MMNDERAVQVVERIWLLAKGWLPQFLAVLATGFSLVWGGYGESMWTNGLWAAITTGALLLAAGVAQLVVQRPTYAALSRAKDAAELLSKQRGDALNLTIDALLRRLADHCGAGSNDDRISLYYFHKKSFVLLGRYSRNPTYNQPGRPSYPMGKGAISTAWAEGSVYTELPSTRPKWLNRHVSKHGFTREEAEGLAMQCVRIAAVRIEVGHKSVGVLVFESVSENNVTGETLRTSSQSLIFSALGEIVSAAAMLTGRGEEIVAGVDQRTRQDHGWKSSKSQAQT